MVRDVTAAILLHKGKYLIARRKPGGSQGEKWEFPGGKVEPGETPAQALARELQEEFEIEVKVGSLLCSQLFRNGKNKYRLLAFDVQYLCGDFILHEHTEYSWVTPAQFPDFDLSESDQAVIDQLF